MQLLHYMTARLPPAHHAKCSSGAAGSKIHRLYALSITCHAKGELSHGKPEAGRTVAPPALGNALPIQIPRSLSEIDNAKLLGFGADLAEDHPGFLDPAYKQRRIDICNLARDHRVGSPIPRVDYTADEGRVWATVMTELLPLFERHACAAYLRSFPLFGFSPGAVPQLQGLHEVLQATTGWSIRPTAGLLFPRNFLAGLAFKTFHSTQYMRHASRPSYTPEPDLVHEALGHVPMLADPAFCDMVESIGVASLGADDKTIWHLTKCYWYTVEFGVVREAGGIKAFGAGVLSSFGEMRNMASGLAELVPFDPFAKLPAMSYKDGYQKRYFVLDSFEEGAAQLQAYCAHLQDRLPEEVRAAVAEALSGRQ